MQFIRQPKLIDIAESVLPELVADWMNTKCVPNINIGFVQQLWENMQISWVIKCSTCWMPYRCTITNLTHQAWAIWNLSNHDVFWIIADQGSQKMITLCLKSISPNPFQPRTSNVNSPEWGQQCSNLGIPCLISVFGTFWRTLNQLNNNPGVLFGCTVDIFSSITNREIQHQGMLIVSNIGHVNLVGCPHDWYNCRSGRKVILWISLPVACVYLAVYSATFWVCAACRIKSEVCVKLEMCQTELNSFENTPVV